MKETLKIVSGPVGLAQLEQYLADKEYVAYDTETTGLEKNAEVIGFSVSAEPDVGWYVILAEWITRDEEVECSACEGHGDCGVCNNHGKVLVTRGDLVKKSKEFVDRAVKLLETLKNKKLIMHNGMVDVNWTKANFGVDLQEALHTDTMVLSHLLNEDRPGGYGLKELAYSEFGESAKREQMEMKASVLSRGGIWEEKRGGNKEMYKADSKILAKYGAKDTVLTYRLFVKYVPQLYEEKLEAFFYDDECMPLYRYCTYDLNMVGLKVDVEKIKQLEQDLEREVNQLREEVLFEIAPYIKDKYPGTNKGNTFNIGSSQQMSWLLFMKLGNDWKKLTKGGRKVAQDLIEKVPYNPSGRKAFYQAVVNAGLKPEKYIQCDKKALMNLATKYGWVAKILKYKQSSTLLKTYAKGLQQFIKYGVITPGFKQHGTTSGRYSSSKPNFQNLPRDDKRVKACIVARTGKVFVGADYSQLEPRTFTAMSQDPILMDGFKKGEDFYGVIGIPVFNLYKCSANKKAPNYIGSDTFEGGKYKYYRQIAKVIALSLAYGTTPYKLSDELRDQEGKNMPVEQCTAILDGYFEKYVGVDNFVKESHLQIVNTGKVFNLFGRPRRIPEAKKIKSLGFPKSCDATDLPYQYRTLLNLAVNHRVQSTAASIVNRACIEFYKRVKELGIDAKVVLQVHDEIVIECAEEHGKLVADMLKDVMENTVKLPGVDLVAEPKIGKTLADLK